MYEVDNKSESDYKTPTKSNNSQLSQLPKNTDSRSLMMELLKNNNQELKPTKPACKCFSCKEDGYVVSNCKNHQCPLCKKDGVFVNQKESSKKESGLLVEERLMTVPKRSGKEPFEKPLTENENDRISRSGNKYNKVPVLHRERNLPVSSRTSNEITFNEKITTETSTIPDNKQRKVPVPSAPSHPFNPIKPITNEKNAFKKQVVNEVVTKLLHEPVFQVSLSQLSSLCTPLQAQVKKILTHPTDTDRKDNQHACRRCTLYISTPGRRMFRKDSPRTRCS